MTAVSAAAANIGIEERTALLTLSSCEKQMWRRSAKGKDDRTIAQEIGCTEPQVSEQRQALLKKMSIQSDAQLLAAIGELARLACQEGELKDGAAKRIAAPAPAVQYRY